MISVPQATQPRKLKQRTTEEVVADLRALAASKGGRLVTTDYRGARHKVELECGHGHHWEAYAHNIFSKDSWCPYCYRNDKAGVYETIVERARALGGRCLSDSYVSHDTPMSFECNNGHVFKAQPGNVLYRKTWCPLCARNVPAGCDESDLGVVHDLSNVQDMSMRNKNDRTKLRWRCDEGHTFSATLDLAQQRGCARCARKEAFRQDGVARLQKLAADQGGRWIESDYKGSLAKYEFECANRHRFTKHIHHAEKHWCGLCKKSRTKRAGP